MRSFLTVLVLLLSTYSFSRATFPTTNIKEFSVMSYNAENLFDTVHDEGKSDFVYLPIELKRGQFKAEAEKDCLFQGPVGSVGFERCINLDWSPKVLDRKLVNISRAIAMYNQGKGADVVVMQEVENQNVMNLLLEKVRPLGYKATLLLEDQDSRGIDVAIISKFPIVSSKLHSGLPNSGIKRGIYQFNLNVQNRRITILGNHWPSMHNDVGHRINASDLFSKVSKSITQADAVIALGDYNTTDKEVPNAVHAVYDEHFDARPEAEKLGVKLFPGTYKYRNSWDVLDRVLIRKVDIENGKIRPNYKSFEVINNDYLLGKAPIPNQIATNNGGFQGGGRVTRTGGLNMFFDEDPVTGAPVRFNPNNGQGFSDHLPVGMKFDIAL